MIRFRFSLALLLALSLLFAGCDKKGAAPVEPPVPQIPDRTGESGISYQILVYSFADSDSDGCGDFKGIEQRLDYLKQMGVQALWLSPIHKAASYHGYDVLDYSSIDPDFGSEEDFKSMLDAAHAKGIKIYLDYVLNHTSRDHQWFLDAKSGPDSRFRDWYIFSDSPQEDIRDGKIAMISTEGGAGYDRGQWFPAGTGSTMYHSHFWTDWFADLNYGPASSCEESGPFKAVCESADKWIRLGVDGFRLDAVKHIYHNARSDENPIFLKKFYDHCNATYKASGGSGDFYMVGEHFSAASEVAPYYKGLPTFFEFSFWWTLKDAINSGRGGSFVGDIQGFTSQYAKYRPDYIEATKLSNHDEDRAGNDLGRDRSKMKLAGAVLLTAGGQPYIYQGEELGYWGSKSGGDEFVRTPIMWTSDGSGLASARLTGKIDNSMLTGEISVEKQEQDSGSVLSLYRKFGELRDRYKALAKGSFEYCPSAAANPSAAAWYREYDGQRILVVHNFGPGLVNITFSSDKLDNMIGSNGSASVKGERLSLGAYSSAMFLQ